MHRAYLLSTLFIAAFTALCIAAFSFVIDPYDLYPDITRLSPQKRADLFYHLRLNKPYTMERFRAEHLVIGSSRSARLSPEVLGENSYNASLPGITLYELRRMVEHANTIRPLKTLYLGLDYYMFREGHSDATGHFKDARLRRTSPSLTEKISRLFQFFEDGWRSLLSTDSLLTSSEILTGTHTSQRSFNNDGTWDTSAPGKPPKWLYSMSNRQKMRDFSTEKGTLALEDLNQLLDYIAQHDISTTILISPFHGSVMNTVDFAGKWPNYLGWQKLISEAVESRGGDILLVGIEGNPQITLEPIVTAAPFYQDGVHYTTMAGKEIMNCLKRNKCSNRIRAFPLNSHTMLGYLENVNQLMHDYPKANPQDYNSLSKWLGKTVQDQN